MGRIKTCLIPPHFKPQTGETVLDATLGLAGHASAFLAATAPTGILIGLDADIHNLSLSRERLKEYGGRVQLHHLNFRDIATLLPQQVDILFADLGVSSPHFDDPTRGFTFRSTAPLDMRYDRSSGQTAEVFLKTASEDQIADVLYQFGDMHQTRRLAHALHMRFQAANTAFTTDDVVQCVQTVFGFRAPSILPQVFQALRIQVNDELGALQSLLAVIPHILHPGGRCGIISYHSLEDRLVKQTFRTLSTADRDPFTGADRTAAPYELLTRKALTPSEAEIAANPRARSAKFRAIARRISDPTR